MAVRKETLGPLGDQSHVVVVGGGPAGSACALTLRRLASQRGKQIRITLVEGKQFSGERHHNQCVGVLSPPLPELLVEQLGIPFPQHLGRTKITGFVLYGDREKIILDDARESSIALRRVHYDAHMLEVARQRGVIVRPARAVELEFHASSVVVYTESEQLEADVVVGAFGMDEGTGAVFGRVTPYRPPRALSSVVTKYHPGAEAMEAFGTRIHAFLPRHPRIEFGAITPKGNHLTINIAGRQVDAPLMKDFVDLPDVRSTLTNIERAGRYDPHDLRFFKGRFPNSQAHQYYGDRYVMIGDAAGLVRSFKGKGVTSAVETGIRAAEAMIEAGISKAAFHASYRTANQEIVRDLPYGQVTRLLTIFLARYGLLDAVLRAAEADPGLKSALYGAVSGHLLYRDVLAKALSPRAMVSILGALPHRPRQPQAAA